MEHDEELNFALSKTPFLAHGTKRHEFKKTLRAFSQCCRSLSHCGALRYLNQPSLIVLFLPTLIYASLLLRLFIDEVLSAVSSVLSSHTEVKSFYALRLSIKTSWLCAATLGLERRFRRDCYCMGIRRCMHLFVSLPSPSPSIPHFPFLIPIAVHTHSFNVPHSVHSSAATATATVMARIFVTYTAAMVREDRTGDCRAEDGYS